MPPVHFMTAWGLLLSQPTDKQVWSSNTVVLPFTGMAYLCYQNRIDISFISLMELPSQLLSEAAPQRSHQPRRTDQVRGGNQRSFNAVAAEVRPRNGGRLVVASVRPPARYPPPSGAYC
jgi:hypothetical protein